MPRKTIGILGGMGPEATADLFRKIIRATPARTDQEHLRVIIDNNPLIPDRTKALLEGGENPVPALVATAQNLVKAGAELMVMPCNTAHAFYDQITAAVPIPLLHMIRETAQVVQSGISAGEGVGLLATTGTVRSALYQEAFRTVGIPIILPAAAIQTQVMEAIYGAEGIKAGGRAVPKEMVRAAAEVLVAMGAKAVIAGCTEIPLVLADGDIPVPVYDPTDILAAAAVREAWQ